MGCMLSAASCNKWWMDEILKTKDYPAEQAGITRLGENHVFYLPYLMGERSPHNDPSARATFIGMTMDTTREDMTQAVLEGVAFGLRDSLEVARSIGVNPREQRSAAVEQRVRCGEKDHCKCNEYESRSDRKRRRSWLWRSDFGSGRLQKNFASVEENREACENCRYSGTVDEETGSKKYEERYQKFRQIYPTLKKVCFKN